MKKNPFIMLTFLSVFIASCSTSSNFNVKTVEAVSRSPISAVKVDRSTMHYTGRKTSEIEDSILGKTNHRGILQIEGLNNYSRDHSFSFVKTGYKKIFLFVRELDGKHVCVIVNAQSEHIGNPITITDSTVVTIPMRRK